MNSIKHLLAIATLAALTACGGGDGDGSASTASTASNGAPTVEASANLLLGTWNAVETVEFDAGCHSSFAYNSKYYVKQGFVSFTADSLQFVDFIYTDAKCSAKAGKLTETYAVTYAPGSAPGKSAVYKINGTFTGATTDPDGGSGMSFTQEPDGSSTGGAKFKGLVAVEANKLYGDDDGVRDADGYPTTLSKDAFATK